MSRHGVLDPSYPHQMFQVQLEALRQLEEHIAEFPEPEELNRSGDRYLVNYVTALLGQRGAGKTTVMHELRKKLQASFAERKWLVTEILVPDVLNSRDSIGPAIFDVVFQALLAMTNGDEAKKKFFQSQLGELRSNLSWFYNPFVPNDIIARDSVSADNFARSVFEYHVKAKNLHADFAQALEACVKHVDVKKIIVMIDDADINIALVGRILDVIRYALSSPRIVTIFSSDYATLRRRLFNERLEKLHIEKLPDKEVTFFGSSGEAFKAREVEAERDYVDAYLAKILPPSTRVTLQPIRTDDLIHHPIRLGGPGDNLRTINNLLNEIELKDVNTSEKIKLSTLVNRYSSVLEVNLRGLINQASQISYIIEKYKNKDNSFFEVENADDSVNLSGGLLQMNSTISQLDQAALIKLVRLFLSSSNHSDWLEGLSYFGILNLERESSISKIMETIIARANVRGSAIDTFILEVSNASGKRVDYKKKSEVHVIHLIVDLAILFGASLESVLRTLGIDHGEPFRSLYVSTKMLDYTKKNQIGMSCNIAIIDGADKVGIAGLISTGVSAQSTAPIFLKSSGDMAIHMHRTMHNKTFERLSEANETLRKNLSDDDIDEKTKLEAEVNQFYFIFFTLVDTCLDQLRSAYGAVFAIPATEVPAPQLALLTNSSFNWRVIRPLDGWRFLRELLSAQRVGSASQWDRPLLVLLHLAQMPYEPMIACFGTATANSLEDRTAVRTLLKEMRSFLTERGFLTAAFGWQSEEDFRQTIAMSFDLPHLKNALAYWPKVAWTERGAGLLKLFNFLAKDGIDLDPNADLRRNPPQLWKKWIEAYIDNRGPPKELKSRRKAKAS